MTTKKKERERNTQAVLLNVVEKQYKIVRRISMGQIFVAKLISYTTSLKQFEIVQAFKQSLSFALKKKSVWKQYAKLTGGIKASFFFFFWSWFWWEMIRDWAKLHSIDAFLEIVKELTMLICRTFTLFELSVSLCLNWIHDHRHWYSCVHFYFLISIFKEIRNLTDPRVKRKDDYRG